MSTHARIAANRRNAARSTGPRTPEGKKISAANSTRHGLTGNFRVLPGENPDDFERLVTLYRRQFQPASDHEDFLVTQLVQARWQIERIHRLQSEAFDQMLAEGDPAHSPDARIVAALGKPCSAYDRLERYLAHAERAFHRLHRELTQLTQHRAAERAASYDAQIDRLMAEPLPIDPRYPAYQELLRNEPIDAFPDREDPPHSAPSHP